MKKRLLSLLMMLCFLFSAIQITAYASSANIEGPDTLYKPLDSSNTLVKYDIVDDQGNTVDDSLVSWSASSSDLIIMEDGSVLLNKDIVSGTYMINAEYDNAILSKEITVKDGYRGATSGIKPGADITFFPSSKRVTSDIVIEFDIKATQAITANTCAVFFPFGSSDSNWDLPIYMQADSDSHRLRFNDYSTPAGNALFTQRMVDTGVAYDNWVNVKLDIKHEPGDGFITFDVYINGSSSPAYSSLMSGTLTSFNGMYKLVTYRDYIAVNNVRVYSGKQIDVTRAPYKYLGLNVSGTSEIGVPRTNEAIELQYDIKNMFGHSLISEAAWSVAPDDSGVTISDWALLNIENTAAEGNYTITAIVNGTPYTKNITISDVEYELLIAGSDAYAKDHTFEGKKLVYKAADQFGTSADVTWSLENAADGISILKTNDGSAELSIDADAPAGDYVIKAVADADEGFDKSVATMTFSLTDASYLIDCPEKVVLPSEGYNAVQLKLLSSIGNEVNSALKWACDKAEILADGRLLVCSQTPSSLVVTANFNDCEYSKTITTTASGTPAGTAYDRSLTYTGTRSMNVTDAKNEKYLFADAIEDGNPNPTAEIEWQINRLSPELNDYSSKISISGSKLFVDGKLSGSVYIEGRIKNTITTTGEIEIKLADAFTVLNGSSLKVNALPGEQITVKHHKPNSESYIDAVLGYNTTPVETVLTANSDGVADTTLSFEAPGMHYITIEKQDGTGDEYVLYVNADKLFEQSDIKTLLSHDRIKEYHLKYSGRTKDIIEITSDIYNNFDSEIQDKIVLLADGDYDRYFAAVLLTRFLTGDISNIDLLKSELEKLNADTVWVDYLILDNDADKVCSDALANMTSIESISSFCTEKIILNGVANCSKSNTKEAKPYLALAGSDVYNKASDSFKNTIAASVAGKTYASLSKLCEAIESVKQPSSNGGASPSGGSNKQSGTIGSVSSSVTPPAAKPDMPTVPETLYNDVTKEHWAYEYISSLTVKNIVNGYDGKLFMPENNVTRAEFVKMLTEAFGVSKSDSLPFADVAYTDWFAPYLAGAYESGLVMGDGTNFRPHELITRQDAAVMIYRFSVYADVSFEGVNASFTDRSDISAYALDAVDALSSVGIINGLPDGSFAPSNSTTRAEAAKMICCAMEKGGIK